MLCPKYERLEKKTLTDIKPFVLGVIIGSVLAGIICACVLYFALQAVPSNQLNFADLVTNWEASAQWNIITYVYGKNQTSLLPGDVVKVQYPSGSWAPSAGDLDGYGGFDFYAQPKPFPTRRVVLSYQVMFDESFVWVRGGKLPGIWIGDISASGGNRNDHGYSIRMAWRPLGDAEVYLYVPSNQAAPYYEQPGYVTNFPYGDSLWRGSFHFKKCVWNDVKIYIKMNDRDRQNGMLRVKVNNVTMTFPMMTWTRNPSHMINGIMMDTFFGGSDKSWATPNLTFTYFRNMRVSLY